MKKKILVIDDNQMMLTFMTNLLAKQGHEVVTADDGISALDMITSFTPDVMFIDLILPRIGGDLLCRIIRKMQHLKECYLVILSGALAEVGCDITDIGADACIAKGPFDLMSQNILAVLEQAEKPLQERISGQILGLEGVFPRQMTKELFFRKRHLEAMLEGIAEGVIEIDSGRIVFANSAAVDIIAKPLETILNSNPTTLFTDSARQMVSDLLNSKDEGPRELGVPEPLEINNRLVTLKFVPIKGIPSSIILLITDVTKRTQMEMELQHARKMEAIGTITSGIAHNFRNTLAGILSNSQIIQMHNPNDKNLLEIMDRIDSSVRRGEQLIHRLLEFSYKEVKKKFKPVDLASLIQATEQLMKISLLDKGIKLKINVPDSLYVKGDHSGLSTVLMNLCNNARQAMPKGGKLTIRAKQEGQKAILVVADTGQGMDVTTMDKCFDPFFTTREIGKGTGLGLSTSYGIIKNHNGHISVKSRPNEGTVFRIVLPLTTASEQKPEPEPTEKIHIHHFSGDISSKILIVDDDATFLKALAQLLETLGCQTMATPNPLEALQIYKKWQPDLVLMDIGMPEMDGITCAKNMISFDPKAAIVIVSGYDQRNNLGVHEDYQKLFKGYLTKPIDFNDIKELLSCVCKADEV